MIRFLIVCILVVGFLILSIPILLVEWIIGKFNPMLKDTSSLHLIQAMFSLILKVTGVKVTVIGEENVPKDEPVLYIGNHRSFFDILLTYTRVPRRCGYIAKYEMHKVPLLSNWMKYLHCLFLDRSNPREGLNTILKGIEHLKNGISVVIFPEGTRNKGTGVMPFHKGSFKLADKSDCKIVPMAINNSDNVLENHMPWIKPAKVIIEFCTPVDVASMDKEQRKQIPDMVHEIILETYERNQQEIQ